MADIRFNRVHVLGSRLHWMQLKAVILSTRLIGIKETKRIKKEKEYTKHTIFEF